LICIHKSILYYRKILEKLKHDETLKSMEGSSDLLSDGDELDDDDDMDEDDEGLGHDAPHNADIKKTDSNQAGPSGAAKSNPGSKSARNRPAGPAANKRVFGSMTGIL
jgi:hypothetical protein